MRRRFHRLFAAVSVAAAVAVATPVAVAAPQGATSSATAEPLARPAFRMPFICGQVWRGNNWSGHSPAHSIDWNHYNAQGTPDDLGRRVLASAGGEVVASYYSTGDGYGNTVVIAHGDGWRTRYAHLKERSVARGTQVKRGQVIGKVGATSAIYEFSPHLHYEQIHNGSVVVAVVQGVTWYDYLDRRLKSTNGC
ncbi:MULTISPECIES: M23 family metallopeptidase [unclassified Streptomyces]|uniref:M23 family metallopeptidase n=1 Tax=unclassified Streptomyces TaxID=2593676 RepID=UPI000A8CC73A|nr:M23 family metallopeptidase [Streptomyces sp. CNQ-509]